MSKYVKQLSEKFSKVSDPEKASKMSAYMKNRFEFFGIQTPERRKIQHEFILEYGVPEPTDVQNIVFEFFERPQRELHHFAIEVCSKLKKSWNADNIKLFEKMAITKSWWDSVDAINIFCIKPYFAKFPDETSSVTQSWIDSQDIWLQRLSVISQLRLTDKTDTKLLERNILQLIDSEEFFVQKAIGWALRDYWRTDPKWVQDFVSQNSLKPLSKREALKHL